MASRPVVSYRLLAPNDGAHGMLTIDGIDHEVPNLPSIDVEHGDVVTFTGPVMKALYTSAASSFDERTERMIVKMVATNLLQMLAHRAASSRSHTHIMHVQRLKKPKATCVARVALFKDESEKRAKTAMSDEACSQRASGSRPTAPCKPLAELEKQRLRNIERNNKVLRKLGLA